uniref:Uncharacterized protein n=1 Tax=Arundo donax TaxID=35708 RepID=A0A0A9FCH5_ARUDO
MKKVQNRHCFLSQNLSRYGWVTLSCTSAMGAAHNWKRTKMAAGHNATTIATMGHTGVREELMHPWSLEHLVGWGMRMKCHRGKEGQWRWRESTVWMATMA